jgi:hypothetical protein
MKRLAKLGYPRIFHRRLLDAFPGGLAYINCSLVFNFCNDIQAACFGCIAEDVIGRLAQDVAPADPEFSRDLERVVQTGKRLSPAALPTSWSANPAQKSLATS